MFLRLSLASRKEASLWAVSMSCNLMCEVEPLRYEVLGELGVEVAWGL